MEGGGAGEKGALVVEGMGALGHLSLQRGVLYDFIVFVVE